jgi:hypothetical protein
MLLMYKGIIVLFSFYNNRETQGGDSFYGQYRRHGARE